MSKQLLKDHIARMEDAMLEDVIKPMRNIIYVLEQKFKIDATKSGHADQQSRRDSTNITQLPRRKPEKGKKSD